METALKASFDSAASDHATGWASVDKVLYESCAASSHDRFADVYGKVVLVNRVYAAGVSRASRWDGDREAEVAKGLVDLAPGLIPRLASLAGADELDARALSEIVAVHDLITRGLLPRTNNRWLTSFASKYLHFHCPASPIFDDRAVAAISRHVSAREGAKARERVARPSTVNAGLKLTHLCRSEADPP